MKPIYYIANYPCFDIEHYRDANKAAALQSEYLAQTLLELGHDVSIISTALSYNSTNILEIASRFNRSIDGKVKVTFFTCLNSKYAIFRLLGRFWHNYEVKQFIKEHDGIYIVYHSRLHYKINEWIKSYGRKLILEVEEIYADVTQDKKARLKEINETDRADAYIIPNCMMCPEVTRNKNWVLYHGTCRKEPVLKKIFNDGKIHIIYAGTMDPRKIGLMPSLDAALYLDEEKYHIHVLPIGYPDNQKRIKERISKFNKPHCRISFHDPLDGEDYLQFLQSCEIGLYTQGEGDRDINTSFPSKLMSYMSNGLRIVATKTRALELSEISDVIYFSKSNSGEDIAETIKSIDFSDGYDGRKKANEIHERLKKDLQVMLNEI